MTEAARSSMLEAARRWIDADPDPNTREELQRLVDAEAHDEIAERMGGELEFGTAGLRGVVGAGSMRMNRAVVIRTTRGVADYLLDRVVDARSLPVVIGFDGRTGSDILARDVVGVLVAAGIHVRFFASPVPTPLVAYAARQLGATMAIVITASHNPPEYNGYKVYAGNAVQLASPTDKEIQRRIVAVGPASDVPNVTNAIDGRSTFAEAIPHTMFERYLAEVDVHRPSADLERNIRIVYTPLHGVGYRYVAEAFARAGYPPLHVVEEQAEPDGRFPTVRFPNPEEPGALDLATALAARVDADLVIANDPDADRLSVCLPTPSGRWVPLTGNQIGILLADFVLGRAAHQPTPLVVSSIVSSPMLESIARRHGARCERTHTGFKWICNAGLALEAQGGCRFVFGYEEALGYAIPVVRDKDGISAALLFADLTASCRAAGQSVRERLDGLYREHGLWVSRPRTVVCDGSAGAEAISTAMDKLRREPPSRLGSLGVKRVIDFLSADDTRSPWLPPANLVEIVLVGGSRVFVRPSGTEPRLKIYTELRIELPSGGEVRGQEAAAMHVADQISQEVAHYVGLI